MDTRNPNPKETMLLQKLHHAAARRPLYLSLFSLINVAFILHVMIFKTVNPAMVLGYLLLLAFFIRLMLADVLRKCPRCRSRMTVLKGSCLHCGIYLDVDNIPQGHDIT